MYTKESLEKILRQAEAEEGLVEVVYHRDGEETSFVHIHKGVDYDVEEDYFTYTLYKRDKNGNRARHTFSIPYKNITAVELI